ncbi:MAG TPA: M23 family metallopeptidase [Steroidobacteraceae bacterium]|jgi:murein DD-endopeptidase MepM/ murein hydrolase activator NlpD|nr:M23 family metallopeptidase [Steroidobacteraceae bacterium]
MNVIIFSKRDGHARQLNLPPLALGCVILAVLAIVGGAFGAGMSFGHGAGAGGLSFSQTTHWSQLLAKQREEIAELKQQMQARADAIAIQLGDMKAHVIRLDALGQRLTTMAGIKSSEFNFGHDPPQGGPDMDIPGARPQISDVSTMLTSLQGQIDLSGSQLSALENVILARQLGQEIHPEGRPVSIGYMSSGFGRRVDPFTGGIEYHEGIDFAAPEGERIRAVAAGIVTWAGPRGGYGNMVQIDHGNGYATRYGHADRVLVHVGETVNRGDALALVGNTGRSTGPHVHFEVLRNGHEVNPAKFVALRAGAAAFTGTDAMHVVAGKTPPHASGQGQD